ncbi:hypothetical protein M3210_01105 [Oceanobacillus luteolus]|uniref:hypothetical protein n=1 Tax=Oceanobacillus luteolus TaxID=1274358 RepID=UPI00203B11AA|nr:hypothetical protein [Oceanobacillus luteolus]MCM3738854.1 hypothetical protein [Oceanobacillus luteolus]
MKVSYIKGTLLGLFILLLTGCMYPDSERAENQVPHDTQLEIVQNAVDTYREKTGGLVPIRTKPSDTPIFEKYLVDFSLLKEQNAISEIPGNAFENGGYYQYILITPEENPTVKVIDLRVTEKIRSVNIRLNAFRQEHTYPAFGEKVEDGIYLIDHEKLKLDEPPTVVSPYSQENLPLVMDVHGNLFVDYRIDLQRALEEYDHDYKEGDDIRFLLTDHTPFAPTYSLPYTVKDGEPVFMMEE